MPQTSASSLHAALFAFPSTAGAVTRTITAPSRLPAISFRDDPGWTLTLSRVSAKLLRDREARRGLLGRLRRGTARFAGALDRSLAAALAEAVVERLDPGEDELCSGLLLLVRRVLDL